MAQAARLSLRMQKELKLLLTDPPPGVSLPMLSSDVSDLSSSSSSSNLSSIDACIEGPEGTVYAKGVFKIKIQIPERYPFQPPNVTFGTPIYHPNIDNGGRICLDILNLPPKGAWQPSLNISTVLTSIGLLLSEPNPDDGLMCEASREYKYNRQTFDQKARTLTERYAKAGCSGGGQSTPLDPNPSSTENEVVNLEFINVETEKNASCKKLSEVRRKLSLESSGPSQRRNTEGTVTRSQELSPSQLQDLSEVCPSVFMPMPQVPVDSNDEQPTHQVHVGKPVSVSTSASSKKLCRINGKQSSSLPTQRRKNNEKESMELIPKSSVSHSETLFMASSKNSLSVVGTSIKHQSEQISECEQESNPLCPPLRRADDRDSHIASVASSKLSLMRQNAKCGSQQLHRVHNEVENDGINTSTKQCEIIRIQPAENSSTAQASDSYNSVKSHSLTSYRKTLHPRSTTSSNSVIQQTSNCDEPEPPHDHGARKKLFGVSRKLCLGSAIPSSRKDFDDKENVDPLQKFPLATTPQGVKSDVEQLHKHNATVAANENTKQHDEEGSPVNDAAIVLDSEDSEEEQNGPKRSRLSLAGRRIIGKAKASR